MEWKIGDNDSKNRSWNESDKWPSLLVQNEEHGMPQKNWCAFSALAHCIITSSSWYIVHWSASPCSLSHWGGQQIGLNCTLLYIVTGPTALLDCWGWLWGPCSHLLMPLLHCPLLHPYWMCPPVITPKTFISCNQFWNNLCDNKNCRWMSIPT